MSRSSITTRKKMFPPVHPGAILTEDLEDAAISMNKLAQAIHVPMNRISAIVNGRRGITGDTALRLARYWGTTPEYWMNLQSHYELEIAKDAAGSEFSAIKPHSASP
jgi:antitoxin HigA-1